MADRQCTQCGQTDDHPKVLVNPDRPDEALYHYDCLPFSLREADPYVANAVELAKSGVHGDDLRNAITVVEG